MSIMRSVLLAGAENVWLRERAMRTPFVRRSVSRFMPGETMDDALAASRRLLAEQGTGTILTHLGENLSSLAEAEAVTGHYLDLLDRVVRERLNVQVSVKLTQLGLDHGIEDCYRNLAALVDRAAALGNMIWIDMESTKYVDPTLALFRRVRERSGHTGVCLQSYLTAHRLGSRGAAAPGPRRPAREGRLPRAAGTRVPPEGGRGRKLLPARQPLLRRGYRRRDVSRHRHARRGPRGSAACRGRFEGGGPERYEFEMLYGIQRPLQARLVRDGLPLRVLISYGEFWFPWYMRRLAERPANVLFVAKSLFAR